MSVEPGNRLWNRLLARAEARAAEGTRPESHHYHRVSASDDHLRSSFENSLIYHGLKIETEFNLRLQPTPRKRKAKRKSDLPVAERLRNDRAVAGSPGPTHRTPTGTPTRRISKSTPLSRPPIPIPPPLPSIPVTTKAATARERIPTAVSNAGRPPALHNPPVVEISETCNDVLSLERSAKRSSGSGAALPHFDLAPDSNDTSLWEEDAILVVQPSKVDERADARKLDPKDMVRDFEKKNSAEDLRAPYKTSKKDRVRRARARKIADSDSSLAGDSDSGKSKHAKESRHQGIPRSDSSREPLKSGSSSDKHGMSSHERNMETSKAQPSTSSNGESSSRQKMSNPRSAADNQTTADVNGSKGSLLTEELLARITTLKKKDSKDASRTNHVVCLSSSSDEEHSNTYRSNPPMRALLPRRRTPPNVSVQDKLFGRLSPLSSPRRRTRSMSNSKKRSSTSDVVSSPMEGAKPPASRRKDIQDSCETSGSTERKTKGLTSSVRRTPSKRLSRRLVRHAESRKRDREGEVIATRPTSLQATTRGKSPSPISSSHQQNKAKHSVEIGSPGDLSDEIFDVDLMTVEVNKIQNLPKNIKRNKTPPSSSLSESTIDVEEINGNRRSSAIRRKSRNHGIPLSVNATFPGQHRVTPISLEPTGNPTDVLEILDGDSDVCPASVSPVVKRRRVASNNRGRKRADRLGREEKELSKKSSAKSVSLRAIQSPEATRQENEGERQIAANQGHPLRLPRSVILQEYLNPPTKDSSTKTTSPSSDSSLETLKQSIQRKSGAGVTRRHSSRARRYAAVQEHRKTSSESAKEKTSEGLQEDCRSPATDSYTASQENVQDSSHLRLPLRIRRRMTSEEGMAPSSRSPRGRCSDKTEDTSRLPAKSTQKQAKRDVGSSSSPGLLFLNRKRTAIQKEKKASEITPKGRVWDSLSERVKQRIRKALNGEAAYDSDDSFDSESSGRKRGRKYAVYQDGRLQDISDWKS